MIKKADWLTIVRDRSALFLLAALLISCVVLAAIVILRLHASDIQIPVRYTGFGQTYIYRSQWYTQYSYVGFAAIIAIINTFLSIKIYPIRRLMSLGLICLSIFTVVLAIIVVLAMFNLVPSL